MTLTWNLHRIVENFVAIIVSCMPACASFAKTNFSEFTFASLRTKLFSSTKSSKRTIPSSVTAVGTGQTDSQTNLRDGQYYQLKERSGLFGSGNSKTVIEAQKSSTPPPGITKSVGVEQFSAHREEVWFAEEKKEAAFCWARCLLYWYYQLCRSYGIGNKQGLLLRVMKFSYRHGD